MDISRTRGWFSGPACGEGDTPCQCVCDLHLHLHLHLRLHLRLPQSSACLESGARELLERREGCECAAAVPDNCCLPKSVVASLRQSSVGALKRLACSSV